MKKIFISVEMRARSISEVENDILRASNRISECVNEPFELVDNWNCKGPENAGRLWYLGEAIKKLGDCDICYFVKGWQKANGCKAEMEICKLYGIEIMEEK